MGPGWARDPWTFTTAFPNLGPFGLQHTAIIAIAAKPHTFGTARFENATWDVTHSGWLEEEWSSERYELLMRTLVDSFIALIVLCAGGIVGAALLGFI